MIKKAYHYTPDGRPCYTQYEKPHAELLTLINNKQVILSEDEHPFIKKYDSSHSLIPAYILNFETGEISFDIKIVKDILLGIIRQIRNENLMSLDQEQLKCMTNMDKLMKIESVKQQLRDLPVQVLSSMSNCSDLTDLKHIFPPILSTYKEMI